MLSVFPLMCFFLTFCWGPSPGHPPFTGAGGGAVGNESEARPNHDAKHIGESELKNRGEVVCDFSLPRGQSS